MARRRGYRTLLAFVVLAQLAEAPMHPYEMKRVMRERGKDKQLGLNPDSLYHAIEQLERAGLIEAAETSREGRRPERTVYRITEAGRDELGSWMEELLSETSFEPLQFLAGLAHLPGIEPARCQGLLQRRAIQLEMEVAALDVGLRKPAEMELPRVFVVEGEYARALKQAELDWVRSLIGDLASGRLTWDPERFRAAAAEP